MLNIVILDGIYANPGDLSWSALDQYGKVTIHQRTSPDLVLSRSKDADIVITNKVHLGAEHYEQLPELKLIVIAATGTDHIDLEAAKERNIEVKNVVGYSTHAVAQHVFALILELLNQVGKHSESVHSGEWNDSKGFMYALAPIYELQSKTLGIYGFGQIGQRVAEIGQAFGMKVLIVSQHAKPEDYPDFGFTDLNGLFEQSDIISLHAPLTKDNHRIINADLLQKMKSSALLINTARGGLINDEDLKNALTERSLGGAAVDVLSQEPPKGNHPLLGAENCIITPHLAWASVEARTSLIEVIVDHVKTFSNQNRS